MLAQKCPKNSRTRDRLPRWAARGLGVGLVLGLSVPVAVSLVAILPALRLGYPLVLVPLLAVGPLAVQGLRPHRAILAAAVAGLTSAVLATGGLLVGSDVLDNPIWSLTAMAPASEMAGLPRLALLPGLSWSQQNVLFL
jgi:hypothetical protein